MYSPAARLADPATKLKGMFARTVCAAPQFTARVNIAPHASNRIAAPVFITASSRTRRTKEAIRLPALRQNRHWVIWGRRSLSIWEKALCLNVSTPARCDRASPRHPIQWDRNYLLG